MYSSRGTPARPPRCPTYFLLPITDYLLPTTYYLLPTTCYLLPTTYYLLPATYYLLPTTYYRLPTTCDLHGLRGVEPEPVRDRVGHDAEALVRARLRVGLRL